LRKNTDAKPRPFDESDDESDFMKKMWIYQHPICTSMKNV